MLSLNIKSKNYMCLDINPDSVIHKHLVKKINDLDNSWICGQTDTYWYNHPILKPSIQYSTKIEKENHKLTMLSSFHISLSKPPPNSKKSIQTVKLRQHEFHELIGIISIADIHVSKKEDKKSAWISINDAKISLAMRIPLFECENIDPDIHLHVSLANLTGNPHDSIARPEDCIIDTITA